MLYITLAVENNAKVTFFGALFLKFDNKVFYYILISFKFYCKVEKLDMLKKFKSKLFKT